ncbi:MAG TPA: hypothetical protein VGL53_04190 [Bryobacteraceae bacterium]|jgi:hypothetical protein
MIRSYSMLLFSVTAVFAQQPSLDDLVSERALAKFQSVCEPEGMALWGKPLCGAVAIVNPATHWTVASQQDPDRKFEKRGAVFVGVLPKGMEVANTAIDWGGEKWATIRSPLPADPYSRLALVTHEAFHRVQPSLGLSSSDQREAHLDTETGRLWLRMELRALAQALRAENAAETRQAIEDALLFRAQRYALHTGAREREAALERQEGLAEYTGVAVGLKETGEWIERVARRVESFEDSDAYARSFAYVTGPAYGLLLDRVAGPAWHMRVREGATLESQLIAAVHFHPPNDLAHAAELRAARYGFRAVAAAERERESRHQALLDSLTKEFVDGPTMTIPPSGDLYRMFNPNELVPFGAQGTYYPTGTFKGSWGKLQVETVGAVVSSDYQSVRVVAPADPRARPLQGPGWTLELTPGWTLRPVAGHAGSFEVTNGGSGGRQ